MPLPNWRAGHGVPADVQPCLCCSTSAGTTTRRVFGVDASGSASLGLAWVGFVTPRCRREGGMRMIFSQSFAVTRYRGRLRPWRPLTLHHKPS